jgi:hypothetical protein
MNNINNYSNKLEIAEVKWGVGSGNTDFVVVLISTTKSVTDEIFSMLSIYLNTKKKN